MPRSKTERLYDRIVQLQATQKQLVEALESSHSGFKELAAYLRREGDDPALAIDRAKRCFAALELAKATAAP